MHDTQHGNDTITFGTHGTGTAESYQAPFDDFTPAVGGYLRSIEWQGYYCNRAFVGSDIPNPVATHFIIRISPHDAAIEGPPFAAMSATATSGDIYVITIPASAVQQQFAYTRPDSPCGARNGGDPAAFYGFTTNLPSPIQLTAGRRYWVSITATLPSTAQVSWHWRFGRTDNGMSVYCLCHSQGATRTTFPNDRAFAIWDR